MVSVVLLGFKLSAAKRVVQVNQRRKELETDLALLQPKLEDEDIAVWLNDYDHDSEQRQSSIDEMALSSGRVYSAMENQAVARCLGMFDSYDSCSASATEVKRSATIKRSETKYEEATRLLFGFAEAEIRADPLEIVVYILHCAGSRYGLTLAMADPDVVRFECVEKLNAHHTINFARYTARGAVADRTFLFSIIAKQTAEDPSAYVVAVVPIPRHAKISPKDEAGAVRAENVRSFRCTELAPGMTRLEYCCFLDLKGWVPQFVANKAIPGQMRNPQTMQQYMQQVRPLSECNADDGRAVGHMLIDLVDSKPEDVAHAVRTFANRTAMLRQSGFRHIGAMLVVFFTADARARPDDDVAITALDPSMVTEQQAIAIGGAISSVHQSPMPAAALQHVLKLHAVLRAMVSSCVWFVPMLEVITARKTKPRRSTIMKRLSAIVATDVNAAPIDATPNADGTVDESYFSAVVWLSTHTAVPATTACVWHCTLHGVPCHRDRDCRCL